MSKRRMSFEAADSVFGDLSDGAYFAAMEEQGWDAEAIVGQHENAHKCKRCDRTFKTPRALYDHERGKHQMHKAAK